MKITHKKNDTIFVSLKDVTPGETFMFSRDDNNVYMVTYGPNNDGAIHTINLASGAFAFRNKNQVVIRVETELIVQDP